jgi:hypothetical protein
LRILLFDSPGINLILDGPKLTVEGFLRHQYFMPSPFHNLPLVQYQYLIRALNAGEAVRDDDNRSAFNQAVYRLLNKILVFCIRLSQRLVQNNNGRIL